MPESLESLRSLRLQAVALSQSHTGLPGSLVHRERDGGVRANILAVLRGLRTGRSLNIAWRG